MRVRAATQSVLPGHRDGSCDCYVARSGSAASASRPAMLPQLAPVAVQLCSSVGLARISHQDFDVAAWPRRQAHSINTGSFSTSGKCHRQRIQPSAGHGASVCQNVSRPARLLRPGRIFQMPVAGMRPDRRIAGGDAAAAPSASTSTLATPGDASTSGFHRQSRIVLVVPSARCNASIAASSR